MRFEPRRRFTNIVPFGHYSVPGKVYLALLRLRAPSRVSIIAKFADIPRQAVYRLLDELQNLGEVQKMLVNIFVGNSREPL